MGVSFLLTKPDGPKTKLKKKKLFFSPSNLIPEGARKKRRELN